ncbi:hypothetical protein Tsp_12885 [Trichinella spiralis]|uniref:hypothetical protein n=1 Tax=Trichinella spiralis TaxID=6334 RepID=UPI0001EFD428|nr:hypothetical protein Tsp_12885 [Trichinella spiralis]
MHDSMKTISTGFCITKVKFRHKCNWNQQLLLTEISMQHNYRRKTFHGPGDLSAMANYPILNIWIKYQICMLISYFTAKQSIWNSLETARGYEKGDIGNTSKTSCDSNERAKRNALVFKGACPRSLVFAQ